MKIFKTKKYSILSGLLKYSFVIVFAVMLVSPLVFAAPGFNTGDNNSGYNTGDPNPGYNTGANIETKIQNPLNDKISDIPSFIKEIITIVMYVGVPIIALAIIYTGLLFVQAQGNSEKLTKAKNSLVYTLIGAALLLGAFVIAEAIGKTVDDIKKTT